LRELRGSFRGLLFTNLVDFDSLYGHRRDPQGYARALEEFDRAVPDLLAALTPRDLLVITADHGNDPTHAGTDHTREYVPLLVASPAFTRPEGLGTLPTYADLAATIADHFGAPLATHGRSFLKRLV
jgi:phosphopentomutase